MEEKMFTGKPDLSQTIRSYKTHLYYHPGKWVKSQFAEKEIWNCCANEIKDSQGCQYLIKDQMAWQYK